MKDEITRVETASFALSNCPSRFPEAEFAEVEVTNLAQVDDYSTLSGGSCHSTLFPSPPRLKDRRHYRATMSGPRHPKGLTRARPERRYL